MFTLESVEPISRQAMSQPWRPPAQLAALPERSGPHGLRHYYARHS